MSPAGRRMCTDCAERPAVAKGLCLRCYKRARAGRGSHSTTLGRYGQPDGHGYYGILDDDGDTLTCHECGSRFRSLGAHAFMAHGMTAAEYRSAHGLARGRSLVSTSLHEAYSARSTNRVGSAGWHRFEKARDPQAAAATRTFPPASAQAHHVHAQQAALNGKQVRKARVRTCPVCGAQWCPLPGGYKRRLCGSADCLRLDRSRATRQAAQQRAQVHPPFTPAEARRLRELTGAEVLTEVRRFLAEGRTQRSLADALGISPSGLCRALKGHRVPRLERPRPQNPSAPHPPEDSPAQS